MNELATAASLTSWRSFNENGKHILDTHANNGEDDNPMKRARVEYHHYQQQHQQQQHQQTNGNYSNPGTAMMHTAHSAVIENVAGLTKPQLKPYPFFYYQDYSKAVDEDPYTPLTFPGRVPNFPAKLHAILSRSDLSDIIDWLPHGRSWRVLKPREFESKIIPKFFEHSKFSSFVRQANGWGFRRITQGPDRNSYYHELFLRGLPHLCKRMRRPGVAEKKVVDPDLEPDFYKISDIYPIPNNSDEESLFLQKTLESGPKARMPIITGHFKKSQGASDASSTASSDDKSVDAEVAAMTSQEGGRAPAAQAPVASTERREHHHAGPDPTVTYASSSVSEEQQKPVQTMNMSMLGFAPVHVPNATAHRVTNPSSPAPGQSEQQTTNAPAASQMTGAPAPKEPKSMTAAPTVEAPTAQQMIMAATSSVTPEQMPKLTEIANGSPMALPFPMPTLDSSNPAASSFAAGFAAATAHYQQQFYAMMSKMAVGGQMPEGFSPMGNNTSSNNSSSVANSAA